MNKYDKDYQEFKDIWVDVKKLGYLGKTKEFFDVLQDGLKKYPNNKCIKHKLMEFCFSLYEKDNGNEYYEKLVEKLAIELKEDDMYKYDAIETLAYLYRIQGKQDNIYEDVCNLPSIWQSKEFLMPEVLKFEARIKAVEKNFLVLINLFDHLLLSTYGREEVGKRDIILLKEKALIDIIFENSDYGVINHHLQNIYYRCARDQAYIKNKEKTIEYLKESIKYAKSYDDLRYNSKKLKHTSFLVDRLEDNLEDGIFTMENSLTEFMGNALNDKLFDFIKEEIEFKNIKEQLNK